MFAPNQEKTASELLRVTRPPNRPVESPEKEYRAPAQNSDIPPSSGLL
jgi:hypothetical protein